MGYRTAAVTVREAARVAAVVLVFAICAVVEFLAQLRLLARFAPPGLTFLLALVLLAIPESVQGRHDVESVV